MPIPIDNPEAASVPARPAFVPNRLGVRRVLIDVDRDTNAIRASLTPCPATIDTWGPVDAAEVTTSDLVAELMAAPDSAEKSAALQAVKEVSDRLVTIGAFLIATRA